MEAMIHKTDSQSFPVVAVFDFDGTLTQRDSLLPFLLIAVGPWQFWRGLVVMSPVLLGYVLKLIPNWRAKEAVLTHYLSGRTVERFFQLAQNFAIKEVPKLLRPEAIECLQWHQEQGHRTILISASWEAYLLPLTQILGFDQVIGTKLESHAGFLTGRIQGKNCYGKEKVKRLQALIGDLSDFCIYAYGDSRGDLELLEVATFAFYRKFLARSGNRKLSSVYLEQRK